MQPNNILRHIRKLHHGTHFLKLAKKQVCITLSTKFREHSCVLRAKCKLHIFTKIRNLKTRRINGPWQIEDLIQTSRHWGRWGSFRRHVCSKCEDWVRRNMGLCPFDSIQTTTSWFSNLNTHPSYFFFVVEIFRFFFSFSTLFT